MDNKPAALDLARGAIAPTTSTAKPPEKFTYALPAFTVQRRKSGWWISPHGRESPARSPNGQAHSRRSKRPASRSPQIGESKSLIAAPNLSSGTG